MPPLPTDPTFAEATAFGRAAWDRDVAEGRRVPIDREDFARKLALIATCLPARRDAQQVVHRRSCTATPCMVTDPRLLTERMHRMNGGM